MTAVIEGAFDTVNHIRLLDTLRLKGFRRELYDGSAAMSQAGKHS